MAAFKIDERKLQSVLPPPVSSWREDLKWSAAVIGTVVLFIGSAALLLYGVLRGLF